MSRFEHIYKSSWFTPLMVWALSFYSTLLYSLKHFIINSDSLIEFDTYKLFIKQGFWSPIIDNILSSSMWTTYFPSIIQRVTNFDAEIVYRVWLAIVISFLPMVCYLLFKHYTSQGISIGLTIVLYTSFYYQGYSQYARMLIAITIAVCLVISILNKSRWKYLFIALSVVGLIIAHYTVAYIWVGILIGTYLVMVARIIIWKKETEYFTPIMFSILLMVSCMYIYYGRILVGAVSGYATSGAYYVTKEAISTIESVLDNGVSSAVTATIKVWDIAADITLARILLISRMILAFIIWIYLFKGNKGFTAISVLYIGVIFIAVISMSNSIIETAIGSLRPSFIVMPLELLGIAYWWGDRGGDYRLYPILATSAIVYH